MSLTANMSIMKDADENFQAFIVVVFIFLVLIIATGYVIYLSGLKSRECSHMNTLYPSINGNISSFSNSDPDYQHNFCDYYIKTAYNACSGGSYKNDFVDICNLKALLKQGVRGLDFEVYSVDGNPVVSTSTSDNYHIKETFNSVPFSDVMDTIKNYGFSSGSCPNYKDPIIIHLRFKSNYMPMYAKLAEIFKMNSYVMLGKEYSYEAEGKSLGNVKLTDLSGKVVLIVDRSNTSFLENEELLEFVNMTSNSVFMRKYDFYGVKNNPDMNELIEYNKRGMTIVLPDKGINPTNPSGLICRANGCQMVAMRFQYVDNNLMEDTGFYDKEVCAYVLKPEELRFKEVVVNEPSEQLPEYSYATRNISTDFYSFDF